MTDLDRIVMFVGFSVIGLFLWHIYGLLNDVHGHLARMEENIKTDGLKEIFKGLDLYKDDDEED